MLTQTSAQKGSSIAAYSDLLDNAFSECNRENPGMFMYTDWINEYVNSMHNHDWPAALAALRYLIYIDKPPGAATESAKAAREYAIRRAITGPDYATVVYQFIVYSIDQTLVLSNEASMNSMYSAQSLVLLQLVQEVAAAQCRVGFSDNLPAHKWELIHTISKSNLDAKSLEKLLISGYIDVPAVDLNLSTDIDVPNEPSKHAALLSHLADTKRAPIGVYSVDKADKENVIAAPLCSPSPRKALPGKMYIRHIPLRDVDSNSGSKYYNFDRKLQNNILSGLDKSDLPSTSAVKLTSMKSLQHTDCADVSISDVLHEINGLVEVLSPEERIIKDLSLEFGIDYVSDNINLGWTALKGSLEADIVPWYDFEGLDSSTWETESDNRTIDTMISTSVTGVAVCGVVETGEIAGLCASDLSSVHSEGMIELSCFSSDDDVISISDKDSECHTNSALDYSAESCPTSIEMFATDGTRPIAEIAQFMVVGSDTFTLGAKTPSSPLMKCVDDNDLTTKPTECSDCIPVKCIETPTAVSIVQNNPVLETEHSEVATTSVAEAVQPSTHIRYWKVFWYAIIPGTSNRYRAKHRASRFRHSMVSVSK